MDADGRNPRDGRLLVRDSATAGVLLDPRTTQRVPAADLTAEPTLAPDGRSFAYVVRPEQDEANAGLWVGTLDGSRRRVFEGLGHEYSNRARGTAHSAEADTMASAELPPRRRCSPSWARLIAKVYRVDPLEPPRPAAAGERQAPATA